MVKVLGVILALIAFGAFSNGDVGFGLLCALFALIAFGSGGNWRHVGSGRYDVYKKD